MSSSGLDQLSDRLRNIDPLHELDLQSLHQMDYERAQWRTIRSELGLTQADVAALMRTSQSVVSALEAGETDPRMSTVRRYLAAIGRCLTVHAALPDQPA